MTTSRRNLASNRLTESSSSGQIDLEQLQQSADEYLLDHVGDLLVSGAPVMASSGKWEIPILLSTSRGGIIGEVGKLKASSLGEINTLTAGEYEELKRRAREVATGSTS